MSDDLRDRLAGALEEIVLPSRCFTYGFDGKNCENTGLIDSGYGCAPCRARALLAEWRAEREMGKALDLSGVPVFTSWVLPADGFWCHPDVLIGKLVPHRAPDPRPWTHEMERVEHEYRAHVEANDPDGSKMGYCAVPGCMRPRAHHAPVPAPPEGEGKGTDD